MHSNGASGKGGKGGAGARSYKDVSLDMLAGPREPHWTCRMCRFPSNFACRLNCLFCGEAAPRSVQAAAFANQPPMPGARAPPGNYQGKSRKQRRLEARVQRAGAEGPKGAAKGGGQGGTYPVGGGVPKGGWPAAASHPGGTGKAASSVGGGAEATQVPKEPTTEVEKAQYMEAHCRKVLGPDHEETLKWADKLKEARATRDQNKQPAVRLKEIEARRSKLQA